MKLQLTLILLSSLYISNVSAIEYKAKMIRVVDGDTIEVLHNNVKKKIRLRHIDAPERSQRYGLAAKKFLSSELEGKYVTVNTDYKDRYGRDIGDIFIYESNVAIYINAKLIKTGNAWVYKSYRRNSYLMNLENHARENHLGLWKQKAPLEPWLFRDKKRKN